MLLGIPCQSLTMARVPAVRTKVCLLGMPDLTPTHSQRFEMGNQLVSFQVSGAWHLCCQGSFSVANHERSPLWRHPDVLEPFGSLVMRQSWCAPLQAERCCQELRG